jgi:RimJ/RimL family protein N-acetyltransferase
VVEPTVDEPGAVRTARLLLRPWREEDGAELQRLFRDPAVRGGRSLDPDRVVRIAQDSLRQWRTNGFGPWAAVHRDSGAWVGRIGLDELDGWPDSHRVEVGFELHREWWGQGLATEGARAALWFGFAHCGLARIISVTAAANAAARRVMEKAGLRYEGTRHWMSPHVPVVWYVIDRASWQAAHGESGAPTAPPSPPNPG